MTVLIFIYLLCLVCWLGAVVFFSFFTAPVIFTRLPAAEAGKVISGLFPRYYLLGYCAGAIALVIGIYMLSFAAWTREWWLAATVAIGIALGCTLYAGMVVRPRVDSIRTVAEQLNPDRALKAEFDHLHHLSVVLNGAVLLLDLFALFGTAAALAPRG